MWGLLVVGVVCVLFPLRGEEAFLPANQAAAGSRPMHILPTTAGQEEEPATGGGPLHHTNNNQPQQPTTRLRAASEAAHITTAAATESKPLISGLRGLSIQSSLLQQCSARPQPNVGQANLATLAAQTPHSAAGPAVPIQLMSQMVHGLSSQSTANGEIKAEPGAAASNGNDRTLYGH